MRKFIDVDKYIELAEKREAFNDAIQSIAGKEGKSQEQKENLRNRKRRS